jgi:hypothetical protein
LLLQSEDLESLESGEAASGLLLCALLRPGSCLPLLLNPSLSPCSLDGSSASASWQLWENDGCEDDLGGSDCLTGNGGLAVGGWTINQDL